MKAFLAAFALLTVSLMIGFGMGALLPAPALVPPEAAHLAYAVFVGGALYVFFVSAIYHEYD